MKCSAEGCGKTATRLGTKGRAYCSEHMENACKQVTAEGRAIQSRRALDMDNWIHEMRTGAVVTYKKVGRK